MHPKFLLVICMSFVFSVLTCCQDLPKHQHEEQKSKILILTSFYPMYLFTSNITRNSNRVEVKSLIKQEFGDPHHYQLTPSDIKKIGKAKALVINDRTHETFINITKKIFPNLKIIESGSTILKERDGYTAKDTHQDRQQHDQKTLTPNTHFWISPCLAVKQVTKIAHDIAILDFFDKDLYQKNAQNYVASLQMLCDNIKKQYIHLAGKKAITYHNAFKYLFEDLQISLIGTIQTEIGRTPTPKELYNLEKKIKKSTEKVPIFIEAGHKGLGVLISKSLALKTRNKVYELNPITRGSNTLNSYEKITQQNLVTINDAIMSPTL